jgi:cobalt-zinc-cadmium resistance protein CzcA
MSLSSSVAAAIKNRWLVLGLAGVVAGIGVWSFTRMNVDAYPDISGVEVELITTYPGRAAEDVEQQISIPLERAMASIPHAEVIRSRTIFGLSDVQIIFEPDVEDYWARQVVFEKIGNANLPSDAQSSMGPLATAYGEIYRYQLVSDKDHAAEQTPMELRTLNDWVITPRLLRAKGVVDVENFGGLGKQYAVHLDRNKLAQYGVKLQEVTAAIKANNSSGGGSLMERGSTSLVIRGIGRINDYKELENILIKNSNGTNVFIRDVGQVVVDHLPLTGIFGKDDNDNSVEGIVVMRRGANPSTTLDNIKEAVQELNKSILPQGVTLVPFYDRTSLIQDTLHTVLHNTALGIILVVLILFIFLGDPKIAFIVALTIPGSLLVALLLMKLTGIPISLLSVGAIDFGIIVDGAIIISENIIRHLHDQADSGKDVNISDTILQATEQVQKPMLFSMLIVIVAYLPLLSLQYIEGLLFRPMAITLCFALFGALLIALYLVPALSSVLFKKAQKEKENTFFDKLTRGYEKLLPLVLQNRLKVIGSVVILFIVVIVGVIPRLGTEFLPYMDEGVFWLRANFPEGISLQENAKYAHELRHFIHEFQEVSFVTSQTGRNDAGTDPFPTNRLEMMVGLKDRSDWKNFHSKLGLEAAIREKLAAEFPTTKFNLTQPIIDSVTEDTTGTSADLAVELVGPDLDELRRLAEKTVMALREVQGAVNVDIEQEGPQPQLQIKIDKNRMAQYQLSADTVNDVINTAVGGLPVSQIYEGERKFDILTKYAPEYVNTPERIGLLPAFNDQGEAIPLAQVADIRVRDGQTLIAREDGKRRITVRCDIRGRSQGDFVEAAKIKFHSSIQLPEGYSAEWLGMFENLERARNHFALLIPLTIFVIFLLLIITFRSFERAGLVLLTVPFSLIGGALALWIRHMHLSVSAGVGLTSLFGVATMHGVLMVSYINQLWDEKKCTLDEAITRGASLRLRPIVMTAIVAILGLLPASLATGIGSDVQRPIATVVVWGLFSSAFLTLFVIPALYRIMEGRKDPKP